MIVSVSLVVFTRGLLLGSSCSSDSLWWARSSVEQCFLRHIDTADFWVKRSRVKKQRGLAGHVMEDACLNLGLPSPFGELQRGDNVITTNWISRNWGENGVEFL